MKKVGRIFIGTSGFGYPHWRGNFYPEKLSPPSWLSFYSKHFSTVELNSPFYRLPSRKTFEGWQDRTPPEFTFAVKANRFITHIKRLKEVEEPVERFFDAVRGLGNKMGPILFQLPPSFKKNHERLEEFIELLLSGRRYAFEFRHESWFNKETCQILEKHGVALCYSDSPQYPAVFMDSTPFIYARFHGRERLYSSCYSREELLEWAIKFKNCLKAGKDVYVYFDNDAEGYAIKNAKELSEMIER